MNDRVLSALRVLGIGAPPIAALERDGAFFALLEDTLIYQDAGGTRRVTLRDLTRIHSDQDGLLRVETPAGTALTASLIGYDPGRVQTFFAGVRDATARAKHLPGAPLPAVGGQKTFGTAPKPASPAPTPPAPATPTENPAPGSSSVVVIGGESPPVETTSPASPPPAKTGAPTPSPVPEPQPARSEPPRRGASGAPATPVRPPTRPPAEGDDLGGETVRVIRAGSGAPVEAPASTPVPVAPARPASPPVTPPPPARETPVSAPPVTPPGAGETASGPLPVPAPARAPRVESLAAHAEAVAGLVSRLRLLGAVLGGAAIGLAIFQFRGGEGLLGLWTLIAGGVGAIALLAFAEVAGLVAAVAREVGGGAPTAGPVAEPEPPRDGA